MADVGPGHGLLGETNRRPLPAQWCQEWQGFWDRAVAGSSALRAAVLRKLLIELDVQDDLHWVLVLWDLSKFYDTIKIAALITQALAR